MIQRAAILLTGLLLSCTCTGCMTLYTNRSVDVVVTHTETGLPAAGVPVTVRYLYMLVLNAPEGATGTTDAKGRVTLPMTNTILSQMLEAGPTSYVVPVGIVHTGGDLVFKPWANERAPIYSVRLIPRRRSLLDLLDGLEN